MLRSLAVGFVLCTLVSALTIDVSAQSLPAAGAGDTDLELDAAQPDFTVVNLPTTLRLPKGKSAFRVTHRFGRTLTRGSFADAAGSLFGIDDGAQIGLEYRYGLWSGVQVGLYRTSDKTVEFFGQYDWLRQGTSAPVSLDVVATVEELNNFHKGSVVEPEDNEYATAVGVVVSRTIHDAAAIYLQPMFVAHANVYSTAGCLEHLEHGHELPGCATATTTGVDSNTFLVGLSTRIRVRQATYVVASMAPRLGGFRPDVALASFGIEQRMGGHTFQLNFSNSLGSTMAQIARGASNSSDWFMGFNISRKFF